MSLGTRKVTPAGQTPATSPPINGNVPQQKIKRLQWEKPNPKNKYGKNIALIGDSMVGKTNLMLQLGYLNKRYINEIRAHFPNVAKLLDNGVIPEVEKIVILESENNLKKALSDGIEKVMYKDLIARGIIDIIPILIPRKEIVIKGSKLVNISKDNLEFVKTQFKEEVKAIVDDEPETTLFGIDSMSKYKKLLDDRLGNIIEIIEGRPNASVEGIDKYTQAFYAHRNTEWEDLMEYKRGYKGWNVDTYKESFTPDWILEKDPKAPERSTKWITGTPHFLDMVFRVLVNSDNSRTIEIADGKGRYMSSDPKKWKMKYVLNSRLAGISLIDMLSEKLLLGDSVEDDSIYWKY